MQRSPYKFLDSYSKEDRNIFFGREKEVEELHSRVFESKILVVYGTSGTGKSSLINCGLANKFNDSDWLPITVRRGLNINQSLFDSLEKAGITAIPSDKKGTSAGKTNDLLKVIRSIYLDHFKPLYLIFDQFEELFIFGSSKEKDELISNVRKVIDSDLQCRFIFTVREEYLAGFTEFEKIIPSFLNNRIRIEKMTRQNAVSVIEGPCHLNDVDIEPGFSERLLEKLNPDSPDVELTYLQVYLDKVVRLALSESNDVKRITNDLLDRAGDVKDLLGSFLEEQISQLDDPDAALVVLKSFVSVKGTKQQITEEEVIDYSRAFGSDIDREKVRGLIQRFIRLRILRDKDEYNRYELRHDSLATRIFEQITMVEKELLEIRQFLENAHNNYEKRQLFLSAADLQYIAPYEDKLFLNEALQNYISQSKWLLHRARRRRQNALIITAVSIITVLLFFSLWALKERSNALDQKKFADMQKNSAIRAKVSADSASQEALTSRNLAVEKENQALLAQKQSEEARREALAEREFALQQKGIAENLSVTANEQAQIANEEKLKAEEERSKAVIAEGQARRLNFLSTAQNLALKSSSIENNPELMGLLAVQAFNFNKTYKGRREDPVIYEALNKALSTLDSSHHSVFTGSDNEIRVLTGKSNGTLLSADLEGRIKLWTTDGTPSEICDLSSASSIHFIAAGSSGDKIVTQHENKDLVVWHIGSAENSSPSGQVIKGATAFIRATAFSADERYLAVAGRDSSISIWEDKRKSSAKNDSLKTSSLVRVLIFCNNDTLIYSQDDGSIFLRDINRHENRLLYSSDAGKPLCMAWNNNKRILVAGCTDGSLLLLKITDGMPLIPEKHLVHTSGIDLITFNSDFSLLATSSWDKTIKFYNYHEYFELENPVGGMVYIRDLNQRSRSLTFTSDNKLAAGLSDKSIRIWETSSEKLASMICGLVKRNMTTEEWNEMAGTEIPFQSTCNKNP